MKIRVIRSQLIETFIILKMLQCFPVYPFAKCALVILADNIGIQRLFGFSIKIILQSQLSFYMCVDILRNIDLLTNGRLYNCIILSIANLPKESCKRTHVIHPFTCKISPS